MEALDEQQIGEDGIRRVLGRAEWRDRVDRQERRDQDPLQHFQQFKYDKEGQHYKMKGIQPAQPQQEKPSHAETVEQSLLVVRGDDKAAQHEKEIDEKPRVAQERHIVQVAVGFQVEQSH